MFPGEGRGPEPSSAPLDPIEQVRHAPGRGCEVRGTSHLPISPGNNKLAVQRDERPAS